MFWSFHKGDETQGGGSVEASAALRWEAGLMWCDWGTAAPGSLLTALCAKTLPWLFITSKGKPWLNWTPEVSVLGWLASAQVLVPVSPFVKWGCWCSLEVCKALLVCLLLQLWSCDRSLKKQTDKIIQLALISSHSLSEQCWAFCCLQVADAVEDTPGGPQLWRAGMNPTTAKVLSAKLLSLWHCERIGSLERLCLGICWVSFASNSFFRQNKATRDF